MIRQGVCKYCSEVLRANGDDKFRELVNAHFIQKHPKEFQELSKLQQNAQKEFEELKDKYPELSFGFLCFEIDYDKKLAKPQTIG